MLKDRLLMLKKELKLFQVKLVNNAYNQSIPRLLFKNLFESLVKMFVCSRCFFKTFVGNVCLRLVCSKTKVSNRFFWLEFSDVQIWAPLIKMFVQAFFWAIWFRLLFKTFVPDICWRHLSKKVWNEIPFKDILNE